MLLGLPSWAELVRHMIDELGLNTNDRAGSEFTYQTLAEYYRIQQGSIGPLRSWMDRTWSVPEEQVRASKAHRLIVELGFPIIYTTNYDTNLEVAFRLHGREYVKISNARDISKATEGVTQIIKFHGDFDDDSSLVIGETDYFDRLAFESPLDIKFRADALGRTLLFVGYSLSDLNIRLLLHRLWQTWRNSGYAASRPPSYIFMPKPNPVQTSVLAQWGITTLTQDAEAPDEALMNFLEALAHRRHADVHTREQAIAS